MAGANVQNQNRRLKQQTGFLLVFTWLLTSLAISHKTGVIFLYF
jgi:hypothetical protein